MKRSIQFGIISSLLMSNAIFALNNPAQGFYVGILAGINHGPASNQVIFTEDAQVFDGKVSYSPVGADGGVVLGYKLSHFRLEGEIMYSRISTGPLTVGTCNLVSPNIVSPTGVCTPGTYDRFEAKGLAYSGSSAATFGMGNFYYDFFAADSTTNTVPFVGLGFGAVQIRNFSNFTHTNLNTISLTGYSHGGNVSTTTSAMQGILGVSYFMDDLTWVGVDLRYTTTKSLPQVSDSIVQSKQYALTQLNFSVNFAFDKGGIYFG